ncbi:Rod shape-determining protein MreB [Weissella viridescens]|uniref:Rod shape-determining protein MreB n=1 Tax=Weissella viridescens TaxID=1629 RepID=A0A380P757_WEIVI|nr:Rod shape-determining protein MreB [Weissella viridescens]
MVGRTPGNIRAVRPLKDGVISDFDMTEAMLSYFMSKLKAKGVMSRPSIMVCAPTNITEIERKAIIEAAEKSGGGKVYLEYEPKVAAVGAGLNIFSPIASMVIDMGGGTSDIAVLSLGDIVQSESIRVAGDRLNADIANYIKHEFGLQIGERTAEQVKLNLERLCQLKTQLKWKFVDVIHSRGCHARLHWMKTWLKLQCTIQLIKWLKQPIMS